MRYWLEAYLASVAIPHTDPDRWLEEYRVARDRAAKLVLKYGKVYLPFFLKLEAELKALQTEQDALTRVRRRLKS